MSEERFSRIEHRLDDLAQEMRTMGVELRQEMRAMGVELRQEMGEMRDGLRQEMSVMREDLTQQMGVMREQLTHQMVTLNEGLARQMRVLHEDLIARIAMLPDDRSAAERKLRSGLTHLREDVGKRLDPIEVAIGSHSAALRYHRLAAPGSSDRRSRKRSQKH